MTDSELLTAAAAARGRAYAPYSHFAVGAAVRTEDGRIFTGANVENASYGLTQCAERSAVTAAVLAGARQLQAVAVVADASGPVPPCGACRQVLAEFGSADMRVIMGNLRGQVRTLTLGELLPAAFGPGDLGEPIP